jgi:hypothetical protein
MSKGNTYETELLDLVLNNQGMALVGDATGLLPSSADGDLFVALHTADPGEGGAQNTTEVSYTTYARVAVPRDNTGWTVASGAASNAAAVTFPICSSGSATATHFSVGTGSSGAGKILYKAALTAPLAISAGVTPEFAIGDLDISED